MTYQPGAIDARGAIAPPTSAACFATAAAPFAALGWEEALRPGIPHDAQLSALSNVSDKDRGKVPGRFWPGEGAWSGFAKWSLPQVPQDRASWASWPTANVCLTTSTRPALDIDVSDAEVVESVAAAAAAVFGQAPRRRRAGVARCALIYAAEAGSISKQRWAISRDGKEAGIVELLGAGQQVVIAGVHPSGVAYHLDPAECVELVTISPDQLPDFEAEITRRLAELGCIVQRTGTRARTEMTEEQRQEVARLMQEARRAAHAEGLPTFDKSVERYLAQIGDGPGRAGFHDPINSALGSAAKIYSGSPERAAQLKLRLEHVIRTAPRGSDRSPDYIERRIREVLDVTADKWFGIEHDLDESSWAAGEAVAAALSFGELPPAAGAAEPAAPANPAALLDRFRIGPDYLRKLVRPRRWLYGKLLMRPALTFLNAAGGAGKTSLAIVIALSLASGKNLLDPSNSLPLYRMRLGQRHKVLLLNHEDDEEEMDRRIQAAMREYGIEAEEVTDTLFRGAIPFKVADKLDNDVVRSRQSRELAAAMQAEGIAALVIDPFAFTYDCEERLEDDMKCVTEFYTNMAREADAAILIAHHMKKGANLMAKDSMDSARGSGAIASHARISLNMHIMSQADAAEYLGSEEHPDRKQHSRISSAKQSLWKGGDMQEWFVTVSHNLDNATEEHEADEVGVTRRVVLSRKGVEDLPRARVLAACQFIGEAWDASRGLTASGQGGAEATRHGPKILSAKLGISEAEGKQMIDRLLAQGFIRGDKQRIVGGQNRSPRTALRLVEGGIDRITELLDEAEGG